MSTSEKVGEALASVCVVLLPIVLLFLGSGLGLK